MSQRMSYRQLALTIQAMWPHRHEESVRGAIAHNAIKKSIQRFRELEQDDRERLLNEDPRDAL